MKFLFLFLALIIVHDKALAQDFSLNGQIIDYDTHEPIPRVIIFLKSKQSGEVIGEKSSTDSSGKFTLSYHFLDSVDMIIEERIGYELMTTVTNIHLNKDFTISPIPLFKYTDTRIWHEYTKKELRKMEKDKRQTNPSSFLNFENGFIDFNCGGMAYKLTFYNKKVTIDFSALVGCQTK
jgi:hypothetical protein